MNYFEVIESKKAGSNKRVDGKERREEENNNDCSSDSDIYS